MSKTFEVVPFHEHQILTVREGEVILVPLKPMTEQLGLSWAGQLERVKRHPVLSQGIRVTLIPSHGGMQESTCLTLEMVPGYLATIQSERIKDSAVRDRVVLFQSEAFQALFAYFFGGKRGGASAQIDQTARRRELPGLLDRYEAETNPEKRRILYALIVRACESEGIEPPQADAIGLSAPRTEEIIERFWSYFAVIEANGDLINYHRDPAKIAFRRMEVAEAFDKNGIHFPLGRSVMDALRQSQSPRFESVGAVNTRIGPKKTIHAWTFRRG